MKNPTEKKHLFNFVFMRVNTQTNKMCMLCICHVTSGFDCVCVYVCVHMCVCVRVCVYSDLRFIFRKVNFKSMGKMVAEMTVA